MASTTVNFNLKTAGYANFANQTLTFTLLSAGAEASSGTQDYVVLPGSVSATSDANGDGSVSLFRNGKSGIDSVYEVIFPNRERGKFIIPSGSSTIELATLLVDNVPGGAATQQSSVYAAAIQRANHTGTQALSTISDSGTVQLKPSEGAFVDGDKTKLDAIGTIGTIASQASNSVSISGGSISGVTLTASTANLTDATDKRLMTDAQEAKLDSVETNADVTDATNVTAAGALMDSEVDADIKTLSLPASTTISTFAKTFLDDTSASAVKTTLGITDATTQVNFVPNSISFTNTSAFLSLADNTNLDVGTQDFSLVFYAKLDSSGTEPVLDKFAAPGYRLRFVSGALILTLQDSSGSSDYTLATGLNDNKWHTYVISISRGSNATTYVDNVAQTPLRDVSGSAGTLDNSAEFRIGYDGTNAADGVALGNYVILIKQPLDAGEAAQVYFDPNGIKITDDPSLMVDLRRADRTFTDVSNNALAVTTNGTIIYNQERITSLDNATIGATTAAAVTGTNVLASTTLGYTTGSGGTVTQSSSKTTGVTLNKINGEIVMNAAALADDATAAFTLTNSTISATDVVIVNVASVGTAGAYQVTVGAVAAGSCSISILNVSGGSLSEAIKLNFAVIKAVTS